VDKAIAVHSRFVRLVRGQESGACGNGREESQPREVASSPVRAAPVLMRWRRIPRTCWGSAMTASTRIWEPQQVQRKASTSYVFTEVAHCESSQLSGLPAGRRKPHLRIA